MGKFGEVFNDPKMKQAMMAMGLNMLAQSGPHTGPPRGFGQILGTSGLAGMQQYGQATKVEDEKRRYDEQIERQARVDKERRVQNQIQQENLERQRGIQQQQFGMREKRQDLQFADTSAYRSKTQADTAKHRTRVLELGEENKRLTRQLTEAYRGATLKDRETDNARQDKTAARQWYESTYPMDFGSRPQGAPTLEEFYRNQWPQIRDAQNATSATLDYTYDPTTGKFEKVK